MMKILLIILCHNRWLRIVTVRTMIQREFSSSSAVFHENFEEKLLSFLVMLSVKMQSILHVPVAAIQQIVNDINELSLLAKPVCV